MLTDFQKRYIADNGYLPEHIVDYVVAVSGGEPFLLDDYLFFIKDSHLIFIGYPLSKANSLDNTHNVLDLIVKKFAIKDVAYIAPFNQPTAYNCLQADTDFYYMVNLSRFNVSSKLKNSIRRAQRDLIVQTSKKVDALHLMLIDEFISLKHIDNASAYIFKKIPDYINASNTAEVFSALNKEGNLAGFDIVDYGSGDYCFYMFNFISPKHYVPGISDMLLHRVIETAIKKGKSYLNLGLGINKGNVFFKKKWGGEGVVKYCYCYYNVDSSSVFFSITNFITSLFRRNP